MSCGANQSGSLARDEGRQDALTQRNQLLSTARRARRTPVLSKVRFSPNDGPREMAAKLNKLQDAIDELLSRSQFEVEGSIDELADDSLSTVNVVSGSLVDSLTALSGSVTGSLDAANLDFVLSKGSSTGPHGIHVEENQFLSFGTSGSLGANGEIRGSSGLWMEAADGSIVMVALGGSEGSGFHARGPRATLTSTDEDVVLTSARSAFFYADTNVNVDADADVTVSAGGDALIETTDGAITLDANGATGGDITLTAEDNVSVTADTTSFLNGSTWSVLASSNVSISTALGSMTLGTPTTTTVNLSGGFLSFTERASSIPSLSADFGMLWVKDDVPNVPMFTDDTNVDHQLAYLSAVTALDLSDVLSVDNATDGVDIDVTSGDSIIGSADIPITAGADVLISATSGINLLAGGTASSASVSDLCLNAPSGGVAITAGHTENTNAAGSDIVLNASSGISIYAGATPNTSGAAATDVVVNADGGITLAAGANQITDAFSTDIALLAEGALSLNAGHSSATNAGAGDMLVNVTGGIGLNATATPGTAVATGEVDISSDGDMSIIAGGDMFISSDDSVTISSGAGDNISILPGNSGIVRINAVSQTTPLSVGGAVVLDQESTPDNPASTQLTLYTRDASVNIHDPLVSFRDSTGEVFDLETKQRHSIRCARFQDDFFSITESTTNDSFISGDTTWHVSMSTGGSVVNENNSGNDNGEHAGVISLNTDQDDGDLVSIHKGDDASHDVINFNKHESMTFNFRVFGTVTDLAIQIGLSRDIDRFDGTFTRALLYIDSDVNGDENIYFWTSTETDQTITDTGIALVSGRWYACTIEREIASNDWHLWIDGVLEAEHNDADVTEHVPGSGQANIGFTIKTEDAANSGTAAAVRELHIDYCDYRSHLFTDRT